VEVDLSFTVQFSQFLQTRTHVAVNPRSIADFEDVAGIPFVFARHPICHDAHTHMNTIYLDAFTDMDDLFTVTAPPSRTTFVADPVAIIKNKIRDDFIIPNAVDTTDPTPITPLWARCSFLNLSRPSIPQSTPYASEFERGYAAFGA